MKAVATAAALLTVGTLPAAAHTGVKGSGSASGDYAVATASASIDNPGAIRVRVKASPRQRVGVSWTATCSRGIGAGSKSGSFSGRTTITRKIRQPMRNNDNCIVAATGQLSGSGRIRVQILG